MSEVGSVVSAVVVFVVKTVIIRMEHFPVGRYVACYSGVMALYAFLIIKRTSVLESRKSLRCLATSAGRKGGTQKAQRAISSCSVCGCSEIFFTL